MKAALPLLFLVIFGMTAMLCAGRVGGKQERCVCKAKPLKRVKLERVRDYKLFDPSASCSKTEILLTFKTGMRLCLDPKGKQGKRFLQGKILLPAKPRGGKKRKKSQQ